MTTCSVPKFVKQKQKCSSKLIRIVILNFLLSQRIKLAATRTIKMAKNISLKFCRLIFIMCTYSFIHIWNLVHTSVSMGRDKDKVPMPRDKDKCKNPGICKLFCLGNPVLHIKVFQKKKSDSHNLTTSYAWLKGHIKLNWTTITQYPLLSTIRTKS